MRARTRKRVMMMITMMKRKKMRMRMKRKRMKMRMRRKKKRMMMMRTERPPKNHHLLHWSDAHQPNQRNQARTTLYSNHLIRLHLLRYHQQRTATLMTPTRMTLQFHRRPSLLLKYLLPRLYLSRQVRLYARLLPLQPSQPRPDPYVSLQQLSRTTTF